MASMALDEMVAGRRRGAVRRAAAWAAVAAAFAGLAGCAVGPDYRRPAVAVPDHFKEGVVWQRARPGTDLALHDDWWRSYRDPVLDGLVARALKANQSIAAAAASYRVAQATVRASAAAYYPTIGASAGQVRGGFGPGSPLIGILSVPSGATAGGSNPFGGGGGGAAFYNLASVMLTASWEPDLWGAVRRTVEAARDSAQASDAQLAGVRLSIAASVASDYFALRQADADIAVLQGERDTDARIVRMTQAAVRVGASSQDTLRAAQDTLDAAVAALQSAQLAREQDEHAIAVLLGQAPAAFALAPDPGYVFAVPAIPPVLPGPLLERRYDVVSAERTAAAANARIGVAKAAYFPNLTLTADGGFESGSFAHILSIANRVWTIGPSLAVTLFNGGARDAAMDSARASYDQAVAGYRNAVVTAFQSVEDSLSSMHHLGAQAAAQARILRRNERLYASARAQRRVGATSEQDLLSARVTLLQARQNRIDARAAWCESSVTLIKNLGGGWQADAAGASPTPVVAATQSGSHP